MFILIDLLESVGYSYFITNYLSKNKYYKNGFIFVLIAVSFIILQCNSMFTNIDYLSVILINFFTFLFAMFLFSNSILEIIFALLFSESIILFSNITSLVVVSIFNHCIIYNMLVDPTLMIISSILSKFLYFMIAYLLLKARRVKTVISCISMIYLLIIYGIIFLVSIVGFSAAMHGKIKSNSFMIFLFLLSSVFILIYYMYLKMKEENIIYLDSMMMIKEQEHMRNFMQSLSSIYEQNRILRHDIKNMLILLNCNLTDEQKEIMGEIKNRTYTTPMILTSNEALNTIINSKIIAHKDTKIDWRFYMETDLKEMDKIDLAILLGNLLDNALENLGKYKIIRIYAKQINDMYYLKIQNSIDGPVLKQNKILKTTKTDNELHGYGIKSMKRIVEIYDGNIKFSEDENSFIVDVFLKMKK